MNNFDLKKLNDIYLKYGYELKRSNKDVIVYVFKKNMYFGADIIPLNNDYTLDGIKKEFADSGFAVIVRNYENLETVENILFDGFFNTEINIQRNKNKYLQYIDKQNRFLGQGITYQYITSPYTCDTTLPSSRLTKSITDIIEKKGAYLIIIEAAAGFGKTCTAYEILNEISSKLGSKCTFFAELSRNRENRTFKQVLLTEMDAEFPSMVKSDLVKYHINTGRIPLIIDGFDELLSKEQWKETKSIKEFGNVETMLTTIGDLLTDNAKVILTSRKTAIFSGEDFYKWLENYDSKFEVIRITIEPPRIQDWIDEEKFEILNGKKVPLKHVSNPVLLSYLRNLDIDTFKLLIQSTDSILDRYFLSLLEREQVRQNLLADPSIQLSIFKKLARLFTEYNINAESKDFIKELIIDYNPDKLPAIKKNYPPPRPSIDELADILTNHALLDRRDSKDNIGFINDFIFGTLVGQCLCENSFRIPPEDIPQNILELAVTAFKYYSEEKRINLWELLKNKSFNTDNQFKLLSDISLNNFINKGFSNETFESYTFQDIFFDTRASFMTCVFINCSFDNCKFLREIFDETSFVNCIYNDCSVLRSEEETDISNSIFTMGCNDYGSGFITEFEQHGNNNEPELHFNLEKEILSKLFKVDGKSSRPRSLSSLLNEIIDVNRRQIINMVAKLEKENFIEIDGNWICITPPGKSYFHTIIN